MTINKLIISLSLILFCNYNSSAQVSNDSVNKLEWWQDAKFGLFIHWGLYSVAGGDWNGHPYKGNEHFMLYEKIPWKVYGNTLARQFNPEKFDAEQWVKMAKNAGMKYIVITAKHHDGFAMYNSPSSDYDIVKMSPWGKDPMKLLANACKKENIKLCFYYSLGRDWQDPDVPTNWPTKAGRSNTWDFPDEDKKVLDKYFRRKVLPQVKELLTQYGPIGILWFDTYEMISKSQSQELAQLVHQLQPSCIINDRIGHGFGDYAVAEQSIVNKIRKSPWESCITMNGVWGYNRHDSAWKSPELLIRQLIEIASKGGNYLLNVGPTGNGDFPQPAVVRLKEIGEWMKVNSSAIYGTHPWRIANEVVDSTTGYRTNSPEKESDKNMMKDAINDATSKSIYPEICFTTNGNDLYVFANSFRTREMHIKSLGKNSFQLIKKVSSLEKSKIFWRQNDNELIIELPSKMIDGINIFAFKIETI